MEAFTHYPPRPRLTFSHRILLRNDARSRLKRKPCSQTPPMQTTVRVNRCVGEAVNLIVVKFVMVKHVYAGKRDWSTLALLSVKRKYRTVE